MPEPETRRPAVADLAGIEAEMNDPDAWGEPEDAPAPPRRPTVSEILGFEVVDRVSIPWRRLKDPDAPETKRRLAEWYSEYRRLLRSIDDLYEGDDTYEQRVRDANKPSSRTDLDEIAAEKLAYAELAAERQERAAAENGGEDPTRDES